MSMTLRKTPLTEREALALRHQTEERRTYAQIGERFGVSHHRVHQILREARERVMDYEEHGEDALSLVPVRVRSFLNNSGISGRAEAKVGIESGRIYWGAAKGGRGGTGLCVDGTPRRNAGWDTWVILCEWTGQPEPEREK